MQRGLQPCSGLGKPFLTQIGESAREMSENHRELLPRAARNLCGLCCLVTGLLESTQLRKAPTQPHPDKRRRRGTGRTDWHVQVFLAKLDCGWVVAKAR